MLDSEASSRAILLRPFDVVDIFLPIARSSAVWVAVSDDEMEETEVSERLVAEYVAATDDIFHETGLEEL